MKKIIILSILIVSICKLYAQDNNFTWFEKDNKLYYNRNLPVYFWISTSPDNNSQDILMTSKTSEKYANPMYFDSDGYNTLQYANAVDTNTKKIAYPSQTAVFKVYVDGFAPTINAYFKGTRKYSGGKLVYNKNLQITIDAKDYMSGVDKIMYSVNNETFKEYTNPIIFSESGDYIFEFYATDNTGNKSITKKYEFQIN